MAADQSGRTYKPKSTLAAVLLLVGMIIVIVGTDLLFFRGADMTGWRLISNVTVVLVSLGIYMRFIAR
jgi:hypothetical protein